MSSPAVYDDAREKIETAAAALGIPVAWPNEAFDEPHPFTEDGTPTVWLAVEFEGDVSEPIEIGDGVWNEDGVIHLSFMVPKGTGIRAGLVARKEFGMVFRGQPVSPVLYRDMVLDPGGPGETDGQWRFLGLRISYSYQDGPL